MSAEDVTTRQQLGEAITILDARIARPWESSLIKILGAIRLPASD